jgi:hypothetical protein
MLEKKISLSSWIHMNSFRTLYSEVFKVTLEVSFVFVICVLFCLVRLAF